MWPSINNFKILSPKEKCIAAFHYWVETQTDGSVSWRHANTCTTSLTQKQQMHYRKYYEVLHAIRFVIHTERYDLLISEHQALNALNDGNNVLV